MSEASQHIPTHFKKNGDTNILESTGDHRTCQKHPITQAVGAASAAVSTYVTYAYDSTDAFIVGAAAVGTAVIGGTETEFATALAAETGTTIILQGSYRTGALTTGVSSFSIG